MKKYQIACIQASIEVIDDPADKTKIISHNIERGLNIAEGSCSGWSIGDLNQDAQLNILDVTIMINIALGLLEYNECQFESADLNLDQEVNILDILNLVNLILN